MREGKRPGYGQDFADRQKKKISQDLRNFSDKSSEENMRWLMAIEAQTLSGRLLLALLEHVLM